jgi:hypothetical protein
VRQGVAPYEKSELKAVIKEAFNDELKPLFVEREEHYKDHLFLRELRLLIGSIKSNTVKTIVLVAIVSIAGAVTTGLFFWAKSHFK